MTILTIDQATEKAGWAFGTTDHGCIACGLIQIKRGRFTDIGFVMLKFETEVKKLIERYKPEIMAFEAHRKHSSVQSAQMLGAVSAICMKLAREHSLPFHGAEVGQHKQFFTGTGRASKELTLAVAKKKYPGLTIADDNVADAISILHYTLNQLQ